MNRPSGAMVRADTHAVSIPTVSALGHLKGEVSTSPDTACHLDQGLAGVINVRRPDRREPYLHFLIGHYLFDARHLFQTHEPI